MREVAEQIVEERITKAVVISPGKPLGVGIPVLKVGLGPDVRVLVVLLPDECCHRLLVHPRVEEALVVFLDEVSVRGISDFELHSQLVEGVVVVFGQESLIVTRVEPAPEILKRRVAIALEAGLACPGRPIGHNGRSGAKHVDARILEPPDIEVSEVIVGEMLVGIRML